MSENVDTTLAPKKIRPPSGRVSRLFESKWLGWVALAIAVAAPFVNATPYALNIMTTAAIFVLLASGLNIVVGYCGLLDLGYIAFMAVGAYTSGIVAKAFDLPLLFTIPVVLVMTVLAGLIIGAPTLRLRSDYLAIVTLGFGEITRITANNLAITGGPSGIFGIPGILKIGDFDFQQPAVFYYVTILVVAGFVLAAARLGKSRLGRAWRFVREDEDAAEAMGIHTYKVKLLAYTFGAIWGGFGGVLFAGHLSAVAPTSFVFLQSALVLMAVVLGGMGNMRGVVIGALVISLLPELLRDLAEYRYLAFGVLLIVVMLFRPQGFWPARGYEPERKPAEEREAVAVAGEQR
ncbi:branched-chain amino acid ABC transporter permease [Mycetocola sp.]|jgi:branched-chain amino acid transport system permease protein|uniref:branched-chain amino acid ABC transporter permease n=1 Tax=Mycetocola sp. TaxID=1871042 RepID=UPI002612C143|nr:branched-chain amino acid ABC transporter permease [Mycetocola sp.]MCU1559928.1 putative branched-chain amino acid transport, permease component family protein [Mycetocola sp.]